MMNKLDIIEVKILANLVADELERIKREDKKTIRHADGNQYEFDLRMLLHKLEVIEKSEKR